MAKLKKTNNKSITEAAQQIWLSSLGAFSRAQAEGSKLFEKLVRDGRSLKPTRRKKAKPPAKPAGE
ncbi:MAG: phasin family protein [Thermomonas sp.]|jgi:poly(hydroxyalkanoate) granule-associated protein|uniref:phasin family protein n=1 Tax=Thermomonas sp. TaxID=1971895 RepID=UPI001EBA4245|nr:phasin family protein [Thermomonas sp.]MBV2208167.1 phasin family protein [Thermomonas sp.]